MPRLPYSSRRLDLRPSPRTLRYVLGTARPIHRPGGTIMAKIIYIVWSLTLVTFSITACDSEDDAVIEEAADTASATEDAQSVLGFEDVEERSPCEGMQSQPSAQTEPYHEECAGITECTPMEPTSAGSCFCAICGKKAGQSKCLQVQCPQG